MQGNLRVFWCAMLALPAFAQLIPSGQPIPKTALPPVVFVNGYQQDCGSSTFASTFGIADQVLQANGEVSVFFDNCTVSGHPSIEVLGNALGTFLSNLRYQDGQAAGVVDIVAHSMGGLIVRSYLSGKQEASGKFTPPAETHVRKIVFLATPHFGSGVALGLGLNAQLQELSSGSQFLFDLATWNQGTDDLRGVDAVTAIGNGGTGLATMPGFDDGVVALTSAALTFYMPGRTRIIPFCHVNGGGLVSAAGFCTPDAPGIANIKSVTQDAAVLMVSFLNGTDAWKSVGQAAEQNQFLSVDGGLSVTARTANDASLPLDSVTAATLGKTKKLNMPAQVAYTDLFPAGPLTFSVVSGATTIQQSFNLAAGDYAAVVVKPGPVIARIFPAAGRVFPLSAAPRMIASIYGSSLAAGTQLGTAPFPLQLSDAQVLLNGTPIPLLYVSPAQINALLPEDAGGLMRLTVENGSGSHTENLLVEAAAPAIFTQDSSGGGPAAALNARNQALVTPGAPLHAGDFVELFVTGLGATTNRNGLDYANVQPSVTIAGNDCPVSFAGRAPGLLGVDQINCQIPQGIAASSAAPVVVTSGGHASNAAAIAIE